jgi:glycosyltransferase involved in cell wall biosynthesis
MTDRAIENAFGEVETERYGANPLPPGARVALFIPSMRGGGAERATLYLAKGLAQRGIPTDLALARADGPYLQHVPPDVQVVNFQSARVLHAIPRLAKYLRARRPHALISQMNYTNVASVLAWRLARTDTRLLLVEQAFASTFLHVNRKMKLIRQAMRVLYRQADAQIAVSTGVARNLEREIGLPTGSVQTIYNPIVSDSILHAAREPVSHPFLQKGEPPVVLAVGRLDPIKDFACLLRAFALLRKRRQARLLILGEGQTRQELERLAAELHIAQDVSMPGFVTNPYAYMARAGVLTVSSVSEGLPTGLIEAMACGCPVVSTDCPIGPTEILEGGRYGPLVPVGDADALAEALHGILEKPPARELLMGRAADFSVERSLDSFLALLARLS